MLDSGLTLNPKKCQFRMNKLTFFGHDLSKQGVPPSKEKTSAIENAKPPKNVSEARSFLGVIQYSSRFSHSGSPDTRPREEKCLIRIGPGTRTRILSTKGNYSSRCFGIF